MALLEKELSFNQNRDEHRREIKKSRRRARVHGKVATILVSCSSYVVRDGYLTDEDVKSLKPLVEKALAEQLDYYPIPKAIHNKLRKYIHDHTIREEPDLLNYIIPTQGLLYQINNPLQYLDAFRMEDLIRILDEFHYNRPLFSI